ncbi:NAD(P)/FAD-dependent oxidoreductase [Brevibacterium luteolum]|uniref:NAD(P)/FAD-dependent oxidoreductase n=1 Tax=Brevibacterium luteolum TaxID=199591 RepID=UPI0021AFAF0F|nr:FAD-dependent oxidoreductase [Brevibacterium luteolum]MCT1922733.1 FAD-dependent oxidoreductase [Brevibacterium luteolum]
MHADAVVIGGGPAGLAAAAVIAEHTRTDVVVVDEADRAGGRVRGQLYRHRESWIVGAKTAERLIEDAVTAGVTIMSGRHVWSCEPGWHVHISGGETITAPRVVLATGAVERPLPMPGWTLPGVLAVGAVQQLVQVHRILPGRRVAVVGSDPLAITAAEEIVLGGGEVVGIFLPSGGPGQSAESRPAHVLQALGGFASAAPAAWQRLGGKLLRRKIVARAAAGMIPASFGIPIGRVRLKARWRAEAILGTDHVRALRVQQVDAAGAPQGDHTDIEVDAVCLSGGLTPLQELAVAHCELVDVAHVGGAVPLHSPELRTPAPGLYVAGNITGIEGADVAEHQGRLAGTTVAADMDAYADGDARVAAAARRLEQARRNAPLSFLPDIADGRKRLETLWQKHLDKDQINDDQQ